MASSRGGTADLHGTTRPLMMSQQNLTTAGEAGIDAMDVDHQPVAAQPGPQQDGPGCLASNCRQLPDTASPHMAAELPRAIDQAPLYTSSDDRLCKQPTCSAQKQGPGNFASPFISMRPATAGTSDGVPADGPEHGGTCAPAPAAGPPAANADGGAGCSGRAAAAVAPAWQQQPHGPSRSPNQSGTEIVAGLRAMAADGAGGGGGDHVDVGAAAAATAARLATRLLNGAGASAATAAATAATAAAVASQEAAVERPPMAAASAAATAATPPAYPYLEYDPYAPAQVPLASYFSYTIAEGGEEEENEEEELAAAAALDGWAEAEGGQEADDVQESDGALHENGLGEGKGEQEGPTAMDYDSTAGGGGTAAAASGSATGCAQPSAKRPLAHLPSRAADVGPRRRSAAAAGPYGSGRDTTEELDDVEFDEEYGHDIDDGGGGGGGVDRVAGAESRRGVQATGCRGASTRAPHGGDDAVNGGGGGSAPLEQRLRSVHGTCAQRWLSGVPQPQPHPHLLGPPQSWQDWLTASRPAAGWRAGGGSGAAGAAAAAGTGLGAGAGAGAGPSNAGAGPSSAGPNGSAAATAAGGGVLGGWSLRYELGPEFVSADPWSEDEEEEADTSAEQYYAVAQPKDIQGIPWERLQFNRSTYRETRLRQYRNYTNVLPDNNGGAYRAELAPLCAAPRRCGTAGVIPSDGVAAERGPPFFAFVRNSRAVHSNIVHFQLRNLVWATSPNDVFVVHDNCINHWNPAARALTEVLNLNGGVAAAATAAAARRAGDESSRIQALGRVQVSTLCVSGDLVAAGGFMGELVVKRLNGMAPQPPPPRAARERAGAGAGTGGFQARGAAALGAQAAAQRRGGPGRPGGGFGAKAGGAAGSLSAGSLLYCGRITASDNGITNGLEIFTDRPAGGTVILAANNDMKLRLFAAGAGEGALRPLATWPFDWAVNYATVRPGSQLAAVVGDDRATVLLDVHNGTTVARLEGHRDFSFAVAWHPGGALLATGNQDTTTLLWDVRNTREPLTRLAGRMGAIRSLRFTPDGRFLAMCEPADFVHIYDVASGFLDCQEHDFFGEIAGVAFTPDSSSLFVGISDLTYASLMHLERQRCDWG